MPLRVGGGNGLLYVTFNQDHSCVAVGTSSGFKLFTTSPFGKFYEEESGGYGVVEMLFSSSALVALVGGGHAPAFSPHVLRLVNTKRKTTLCDLKFPTPILAVKMNRKRVIVTLLDHVDVYDIANMKQVSTVATAANPQGLCSLAASSTNCYLACPAQAVGELLIYDASECKELRRIQAHQGALECIAFSPEGDLLASASDKGTIVRVFKVATGERVFTFRRGSYPVTITDMAFSGDAKFLAVSSSSETVHIFKLDSTPAPAAAGSWNILPTAYSFLPTSYLPSMVSDMIEPARNFAHLRLPETSSSTVCSISTKTKRVIVVTATGVAYEYDMDVDNGGECKFVQKFSVMSTEPTTSSVSSS